MAGHASGDPRSTTGGSRPAGAPRAARAEDGPLRVLVALAVPLLRAGVRSLFEQQDDIEICGEAQEAGAVLEAVRRTEPDIVLFDTDFQLSSPGLLAAVRAVRPEAGVVVLVNHGDDDCAIRSLLASRDGPRLSDEAVDRLRECCLMALRSSARGCVPKVAEPERLLNAIRTVAAGDIAAGPWLGEMVRNRALPGSTPERVTGREMDIIAQVARGLENREIGEELGIAEQTVKNHLSSAMRKLGLRNRQEVVLFAVRLHLERRGEGAGER